VDSFTNPRARPERPEYPSPPLRRRRRGRAKRLLAKLRGPWLLQTAGVLLFAVLLGLAVVLLLDRL
jgi:hypothetical protein